MNKGRIISLSGVSGAGKSLLIKDLVANLGFEHAIRVTTRKPREGEMNHVDAHFLTIQEFSHLEKQGKIILTGDVFGNRYGFFKGAFKKIEKGANITLDFRYYMAEDFKRTYPEAFCTYIMPRKTRFATTELAKRNVSQSEKLMRTKAMYAELCWFNADNNKDMFDAIYQNDYTKNSVAGFRELVKNELAREVYHGC